MLPSHLLFANRTAELHGGIDHSDYIGDIWPQNSTACRQTNSLGTFYLNFLLISNQIKSNLLKAEGPSWSLTLP